MFKRVEIWVLYLLLVFFLIFSILYGALLRHHYTGGSQFKQILPIATFFAEIPHNLKALTFVENAIATIEDLPEYVEVVDEEQFKNGQPTNSSIISKTQFFTPRTGLISIPSYDGDSKSAYIAIYDLDDFSLIHNFRVNARNVLKSANKRQKTDAAPIRFTFQDPILLADGGVIAIGAGALLELDVCGEVLSVNRNASYHHSLSFDHESNIWSGSFLPPKRYTKTVKEHVIGERFNDDAIVKLNSDGEKVFEKSVAEILFENDLVSISDVFNHFLKEDPIHLNDVEPALEDTKYWKRGDVFISVRDQNSVLLYRPSENKVLNYLKGPFVAQHDVDILSDHQIAIFNNNNTFGNKALYSQIVTFDFETQTFGTLLQSQLEEVNFKTVYGGTQWVMTDGAVFAEESENGRVLLFGPSGDLELTYQNVDTLGRSFDINWIKVYEDPVFVSKVKKAFNQKNCT